VSIFALTVSHIIYSLPAWGSFVGVDMINRVNAMLKQCFKYGYCKHCYVLSELLKVADSQLFEVIQNASHCIHGLLPPKKPIFRSLRLKDHNFVLLQRKYCLYKQPFICRFLFSKTRSEKL
jgi:hypothetical protein